MIATEKGLRRTVRKARKLHHVFLIYRRWAGADSFLLDCWAQSAKSDRDAAMAQARQFKRRVAQRAVQS